jgi:hypothetical protein
MHRLGGQVEMPNIDLTEAEFDALLRIEKYYEGTERFQYPTIGGNLSIPLCSRSPKEEFMLDISRGNIRLSKNKFQNRARSVIVLVRLDIDGSPHRNPDGEELPGTHFHIYRPGAGSKWACPLPVIFTDPSNTRLTLQQFMTYCKIVKEPPISFQGRLF